MALAYRVDINHTRSRDEVPSLGPWARRWWSVMIIKENSVTPSQERGRDL